MTREETQAERESARDITEDVARAVYGAMLFAKPDAPAWIAGGNSFAQDEARRAARYIGALYREEAGQ